MSTVIYSHAGVALSVIRNRVRVVSLHDSNEAEPALEHLFCRTCVFVDCAEVLAEVDAVMTAPRSPFSARPPP